MIIFKYSSDLKIFLAKQKKAQVSIGFVPTMGALHQGHLSLIKNCNSECGITVASVFVNPTQFNNKEDLQKYPKTIDEDVRLLEENGCDVLFMPDEKEMYPTFESKQKHYDLGQLETILEGKFRPGHFQGVCMIMERLLDLVNPDFLFMGQKDYQQCLIIKTLINLMKKNIEMVICPILREPSGLAMSSRNLRLATDERTRAAKLFEQLSSIAQHLNKHNFSELRTESIPELEKYGFKVEYLELANRKTLDLLSEFENKKGLIILVAAHLGLVRLIDNLIIPE